MPSESMPYRLSVILALVPPYIFALGITLLGTGVLFPFRLNISTAIVALLYLVPVGAASTLLGLWPGVFAAVCAFFELNYFFIYPYYTLTVHQPQDFLELVVFLGVAIIISQLVGQVRSSLERATAREHEAVQLAELSTRLARLQDESRIAEAVAGQMQAAFKLDQIEMVVERSDGQPPVFIHHQLEQEPDQEDHPENPPTLLIPLQTARGLIGEVRVWRQKGPLTAAEERLLRVFASQGVLALERARLSDSEGRARLLEESDRMKSALLSSVSHELRTPLVTIKAAVTSLRSGEVEWDTEARLDLLAAVEEESDHLNQLVGNLLNMSRIESSALKPQRQWNVLSEIVGGVVKRFHQRRQEDRHTIAVEIPEDFPLIPVDYVQMEQVFSNLISNGIKYSPPDTAIQIKAWPRAQEVLVQVSNQGPHVPAADLDRIFDKFHRVTAADRITGTGLGLSICKGIIEAHGGRIWAENLPSGFAFNFTLPTIWEGAPARIPVE